MKPAETSQEPPNKRILVIDDNPAIHTDFRKVLGPRGGAGLDEIETYEAAIFGQTKATNRQIAFEIDSAFQGAEGLEKVRAAAAEGRPYAMAFVDVRMPPGWDGVETILNIWQEFPDVQMVICTAYSDYSWDQIAEAVGSTDSVLILKKPFDSVEALQIAHALTRKWQLTRAAQRQMAELDNLVSERTMELQREMGERSVAEAALRRSEERFSKAFLASPLAMSIQGLDSGVLVAVNSSYEALLGYSRAELLSTDAVQPEIWLDPATPVSIREQLADHRIVRGYAAQVRTRDGETRETLASAEQILLDEKPHMLLILQDVTERSRLESQLRQAQRMEAVGQLAAGIAHDFNNLLTVIMGNTSLQLDSAQLDDKIARSLGQIMRASERATVLTRQLLAYSRKQVIQRRPIDLNEAVEQSVLMLRRIIGEHIAIETVLDPALLSIHADPTNVDQVIMNLTLNARDAMRDGGRLTLRTRLCEISEPAQSHLRDARAGIFACLSVEDTGCGMDPATQARLFEPFFTTKDPGQGTGMGLATVYGIVKQHEGWVEVASAIGRGSIFHIYYPLSSASLEEAGAFPEQPRTIPKRTDASILVVEDEELLRDYVQTVLEALGYRVFVVANGVEALALWESVKDEVKILFTDVVMPESISGWQLANRLTEQKPGLKVVFTSGYAPELISPEFEQRVGYQFLPKPYLTDKLARTIADCLAPDSACAMAPPDELALSA